jgi:cytochrome oxidase Cu insertion factor (SCO1/SenC/PrrC family)
MKTLLFATALALLSLPARAQAPKPAQPAPAAPAATTTMPTVGSAAPEFRLNDQQGHLVPLGTARSDGKWTVVAFYPKAATPG